MKKLALLIVAALLGSVLFVSSPASSQGWKEKVRKSAKKIENNYVVVLDDSVIGERGDYSIADYMAEDMARTYRGKLKHVYKHAINGFSVEMSEADAESHGSGLPRLVCRRGRCRHRLTPRKRIRRGASTASTSAIGRLSATYTYNWTGSGVRVYVIDTGIRTAHTQFGGRASNVFDVNGGNGAGLQRPRHARLGHRRRLDLRRGEERHAARRQGLPVRQLDLDLEHHRGRQLGHGQPHPARQSPT